MSLKKILVLFLFLLYLPQVVWGEAAEPVKAVNGEIYNIRFNASQDSGSDKLRIVLETTTPVEVSAALGANLSSELTVSVKGALPGNLLDSVELDGDIARSMSIKAASSVNSQITIRLPLEITSAEYHVFTLPEDEKNNKPNRVVIDIFKPNYPDSMVFTTGLKGKVIVLDPGHGGSDPGAIGLNKVQEKSVALGVSLRVKKLLENAGATVIMTREEDTDVFGPNATATQELRARSDIGNSNNADLFVSIHANSFGDRSVGGTGTYYYRKTSYDSLLAQSLQTGLAKAAGLKDRGIYAANFYVVKHTEMPAALIELAFISNPSEENLLNSPPFQQKLAQGIINGLSAFFSRAAEIGGNK